MKFLYYIIMLSVLFLIYHPIGDLFGQGTSSINVNTSLNIEIIAKISVEGIQSGDCWLIDNVVHKKLKKSHIIISVETNSTYLELQIHPESGNLSNGTFEIDTDYKLTRNIQANGGKNELKDVMQENFSLRRVDWRLNARLRANSNCPAGTYTDALQISIMDQMGQLYTKDIHIQAELIDQNTGNTLEDSLEINEE